MGSDPFASARQVDTLEVQMKNLTTGAGTMNKETMQDSNQLALVQKVRVRVRDRVRAKVRVRD